MSFLSSVPLATNLLLLLGLSLFFGLTYEEFHARQGRVRPGGVRTFPLLAITGGMLQQLEPTHLILVAAGVLVLGALIYAYYRRALDDRDAQGVPNVGLADPACNLLAFLLGPIALTQPHWVTISIAVAAVLLLTGRDRLHALVQKIELQEFITAAKFLILTGIILPLLPNEPVTTLTSVTPYQAWLALLAVCTLSYASYLVQRYLAPHQGAFLTAILGGLYSSTATTVVLARRAGSGDIPSDRSQTGIGLATAVMYLRMLAIVAVFNMALAARLAPVLVSLFVVGALASLSIYWLSAHEPSQNVESAGARNPLEITTAAVFAALFVAISIASSWAASRFGAQGVYVLAGVVGFTDIDPFVLSIAEGGTGTLSATDAAVAILVATASNNVLKAVYTVSFAGRRRGLKSAIVLCGLSAAAIVAALVRWI